jgi:hypothetical protein
MLKKNEMLKIYLENMKEEKEKLQKQNNYKVD